MAAQPIENYGVIGNMRSIALVSIEGAIDFFCFPNFDSPTVFAALLDNEAGGTFRIDPDLENVRTKQLYLPETNILLTRFLSDSGLAEITDFMPVQSGKKGKIYAHQIIRMVRVIKGEVRFHMRCAPRFNYARAKHTAHLENRIVCFEPEDKQLCPCMTLHATLPLELDGNDAVASFSLHAGGTAMFAFGEEDRSKELLAKGSVEHHFQETARYWRDWVGHSNYSGRWREMVNRSALLLKLLCSGFTPRSPSRDRPLVRVRVFRAR